MLSVSLTFDSQINVKVYFFLFLSFFVKNPHFKCGNRNSGTKKIERVKNGIRGIDTPYKILTWKLIL